MRKVLALVASPRKKETWAVVEQFERQLRTHMEVEFETLMLRDLRLESCRGCFVCLTRGEEFCPHVDDRVSLVERLMAADAVVCATPNYALAVTALLKKALDRIAYTFHRPCCFHTRFLPIVTQGAIGGRAVVDYLRRVAQLTGFIYVPGVAVTTVTPSTPAERAVVSAAIARAARRLARSLSATDSPRPPLGSLFVFRLVRSMYRAAPDDRLKDVRYWRDRGWFTSGYFYPVKLGLLRAAVGALADSLGRSLALKRKRELAQDNPD